MNKHLYLRHPLVLSSPTLMMHGHMNLMQIFLFTFKLIILILKRRYNLDMYVTSLHNDKVVTMLADLRLALPCRNV